MGVGPRILSMQHFRRGALDFPVQDRGPAGENAAGSGAPAGTVVLLPGFPQDAASFDQVTPALHAVGLRTLVPTPRGYAPTNTPRRRRDYRLTELAGDVIALLDAAGLERVQLVGHDWGGAVAWAVAGWFPDRVAGLTVLSTPHPAALTAALLHSDQALRSWYMAAFQLPLLPELITAGTGAAVLRRSGLPAEVARRYASRPMTGPINYYRGFVLSLRTQVPLITVPTTYVWGRQDFALGRWAAEHTADHVAADYDFRAVPGGHWLPETRPELVARAVLDRVAAVS